MSEPSVSDALYIVKDGLTKAEKSAGRADAVTLVAVSKQQPDERIDAALAAGHRVFGENRVQEAISRWAHHRATTPDLRLHLIGGAAKCRASWRPKLPHLRL